MRTGSFRYNDTDIEVIGRPPSARPRERQLNIALTGEEHATLSARAEAAGLRLIDYARSLLLGGRVEMMTVGFGIASQLDRLVHEDLKRVGNNFNQIARRLNALGLFEPIEPGEALRELRRLINRVCGHGA